MIKAGILNALVPMNRDSMFQAGLSHILSDGVLAGIGNNCRVELNTVKTGACLLRVTRTTVAPVETFLIPVEITADETIDTSGNGYIILRADAGKINDGTTITTLDGSGIVTLEKVSVLPANNYLLLATLAGGVITNNTETARVQNSSQSKRGFYGVSVGSANALAVTIANLPALDDGVTIQVKANAENTGDATINVNGTGALPIRKAFNQVLSAADIKTNMVLQLTYNETSNIWQAVSVASVGPTNVDMVSVSPTDTTPSYLNNKLSIGSGLSGSVLNPGGNEVIQISNPHVVQVQKFDTTGFHAWTKPAGAKVVKVKVWGAGGGGGGGSNAPSNAAAGAYGGGGGAFWEKEYIAEDLPATMEVVVGAGGVGGTAAAGVGLGTVGGNGGLSRFGVYNLNLADYQLSVVAGGGTGGGTYDNSTSVGGLGMGGAVGEQSTTAGYSGLVDTQGFMVGTLFKSETNGIRSTRTMDSLFGGGSASVNNIDINNNRASGSSVFGGGAGGSMYAAGSGSYTTTFGISGRIPLSYNYSIYSRYLGWGGYPNYDTSVNQNGMPRGGGGGSGQSRGGNNTAPPLDGGHGGRGEVIVITYF